MEMKLLMISMKMKKMKRLLVNVGSMAAMCAVTTAVIEINYLFSLCATTSTA